MTLSKYIRDNTNDGRNIARVLIDVMEGRIDDTKVSHRLSAARLLTIYGYGDVDDFPDDNSPDTSQTESGEKIWFEIDPGLRKLIKARTDDGRVVCMFLIDVMEGRVEGIHVGHRISAAKELLNRAFGKSLSRDLPKPPGSKTPRRSTRGKRRSHAMPPEAAAFEARLAERVASALAPASARPRIESGAGSEPVEGHSIPPARAEATHQPPESVSPEPVEGHSIPSTLTATQSEPTQPEAEPTQPEANPDFDPNHHY